MPLTNDHNPEPMTGLPSEVVQAAASVSPAGFARRAAAALSLSGEQEAALGRGLGVFLAEVWKAPYDVWQLFPPGLSDDQKRALGTLMDSEIFSPLTQKLNESGLGPESLLYANKGVRLTGAKLNEHTTDRIAVKRSEQRTTRGLFFPRRTYHELVLDIDYCEKGRWGDYEIVTVRFDTPEEMERFKILLDKATRVGFFLRFVESVRRWA